MNKEQQISALIFKLYKKRLQACSLVSRVQQISSEHITGLSKFLKKGESEQCIINHVTYPSKATVDKADDAFCSKNSQAVITIGSANITYKDEFKHPNNQITKQRICFSTMLLLIKILQQKLSLKTQLQTKPIIPNYVTRNSKLKQHSESKLNKCRMNKKEERRITSSTYSSNWG